MNNSRAIGVLKSYDAVRGYGFIEREKGKDVFVYFDEFKDDGGDASALVGSQVEFDVVEGGKGPRAKNVKIIG